jgi:hypothetical protein
MAIPQAFRRSRGSAVLAWWDHSSAIMATSSSVMTVARSQSREPSARRARPLFLLVQPGLHVVDAHSAASDRIDDLRWRFRAARVPRAATSLGVEAEQTTAERRAATVMRVGDPARARRDRHRSLR